jgi:hypothetical protein
VIELGRRSRTLGGVGVDGVIADDPEIFAG